MKSLSLLSLSIVFLLSSGCVVSKKKYDTLAAAKKRSDLRARELTTEKDDLSTQLKAKTKESNNLSQQLADFKKEYNDIKNQMLESNARKTSVIEDLNRKLSTLSSDNKTAKDSLKKMIERLDKQSSNYDAKQIELNERFGELEEIESAMNAYSEKLDALEQFITHNFDKNSILNAYAMIDGGFLYITIDPNALFDDKLKLTGDGKRILKILGAALENQAPIQFIAGANWSTEMKEADIWSMTQKKANIVFDFLVENGVTSSTHFSLSKEKMEKQKIETAEGAHQLTFVLHPPLKPLVQAGS